MRKLKVIKCNKCHKSIETSETWKFSQCPDCLGKQREKTNLAKMNKPSSFNPEPTSNPFLSFEEYRHHFPKSTFQQFLEAKAQFEETQRITNVATEKHELISIYGEVCRAVREQIMGLRVKDNLTVGVHLSDCRLCQRWYAVYKEEHIVKMEGFNLWGSGEPESESDAEIETRLLNIQLYQETFNHR